MQFDKIIAQRQVKEKLKDLVQKNRLSHALLFLGKEGSGALPLAIAFAQYILVPKSKSLNSAKKMKLPCLVKKKLSQNCYAGR